MTLNFLEYLGILMIFLIVSVTAICLYYLIKDIIDSWKILHRSKCPFCGAYLHGYQYKRKGAKFNDKYCSRCGKCLTTCGPDSFRRELESLHLNCNDYRKEKAKHE